MRRGTAMERWSKKVNFDGPGGCWLWTASLNNCGYGNFSLHGQPTLAHRAAHELYVGPVPTGMSLDHLCRVRHCVNPDHLEVVTQAVNIARSPLHVASVRARQTHCLRGHEFTPDNTRISQHGTRSCRTCINAARKRPAHAP